MLPRDAVGRLEGDKPNEKWAKCCDANRADKVEDTPVSTHAVIPLTSCTAQVYAQTAEFDDAVVAEKRY